MSPEQYQLICARRQSYDSFLWQTPGLAMAAQAFLIAASIDEKTTQLDAVILAIFSLFVGLASLQLLMKHRHCEVEDSELLAEYELDHAEEGISHLHGKREPRFARKNFVTKFSAYEVWRVVLIGFCILAIYGVGSAIFSKRIGSTAQPPCLQSAATKPIEHPASGPRNRSPN